MIESRSGKIDLKQELSEEVQEALDEMGIYFNELHEVSGKKLHDFMISDTAYTDGDRLIFFDVSHKRRENFIYYMGAETEAELSILWKDIAVYEGIGAGRLNRHVEDKEDEEENLHDT
jgi:hypothetical protein